MTTERVVTFGPGGRIQGIVTAPPTAPDGVRRAVVMSNVGMHHRVGPYRLYVDLARTMAADGWLALRFDHLGMGESGPRIAGEASAADELEDLAQALDFLREAEGIDEVFLVALCSGVDAAHPFSVREARVRGAAFIDGYTYPTAGFRRRRLLLRFLQRGRWSRFLRRLIRRLTQPPVHRVDVLPVFDRVYPSQDQFRRDIGTLADRGVPMHFIFTGTLDSSFNAEHQIFETLGPSVRNDRISVTRLDRTDHVFRSVTARHDVVNRIRDWAAQAVARRDAR